jgi:DNA-binding transcriptional ArsR family regulator
LKLKTRHELYNFISENPGLHLREIFRKENLSFGCLKYHLEYLAKLNLIVSRPDLKYRRYYVKESIGKKDVEILNLLRQEVPLRIIMMLLIPGPGHIYKDKETNKKALLKHSTFDKTYSKREMIELTKYWKDKHDNFSLNKHRTTIGFHIQKLLDIGLIEQVKVGREVKYKLKDENEMVTIFIKYKDALSKKSINDILRLENDGVKDSFSKILDFLYEVFPHPYHN